LDQNYAQNTSLDSVTAYEAKQQPKRSLKSRYESKTRFKVMNLVKKLKKRNQKIKIESKSISKSQVGHGPGYKSKLSQKTSLTSKQESKTGLKISKFSEKLKTKSKL
jgi:hypothetical protein